MPAFGNRLSDDQIDDVVSYIDRLPNGSRNFGPGHDVGMGDGMMDGMIGGGSGWMIVVVIILAAALAGIIGYLIGTSRSRRDAAGPRLPLMDDLHPAGGRSRRRRLTLVLILLSVQALVHGSAGAHGGPAVFDVRTDVSGMKVILDVGITYETDGEAAHGAIVHATGTGPGGERIESFPLERAAHGRYVGSTTAPEEGSWRFTIESSFPPGSTTVQVAVGSGAGPSTAAAWWAVLLLAAAAAAGTGTWLLRRRHRRR